MGGANRRLYGLRFSQPAATPKTRTANPALRATSSSESRRNSPLGVKEGYVEKCLKGLIRLHPIFPLCYAEAAMDTAKGHRPLKPRLCRSPQLTPARLARQVWCSGWKALEQVKRT